MTDAALRHRRRSACSSVFNEARVLRGGRRRTSLGGCACSADERRSALRWRSRWRCARRAWATCTSTWRRSRSTAAADTDEPVDLSALPWPEPAAWTRAAAQPARRVGDDPASAAASGRDARCTSIATGARGAGRRATCCELRERRRRRRRRRGCSRDGLGAAVRARRAGRQRRGGRRRGARAGFAVVAGGPGTGKTTTVARIVALLPSRPRAGARRR